VRSPKGSGEAMSSEMLSGPDLGAGYLHQLSLDREGDRTIFTYHAQEGGADANGPPKGPLDVFGFVHPASPCMFGGPKCWHRRFLLPFAETSRVRHAYNRSRFVLQTMLDQVYAGVVSDVPGALDEVLARISNALEAERVDWFIGGSTAAWLLGAAVVPHDIDIGTTRAGVDRIAPHLAEYLIEPLAPTDWPRVGIVRGARAFVGTFVKGARVEWAVPIEPRSSVPFDEWGGELGSVRLLTVNYRGKQFHVSRPEYALVRALEKHRTADTDAIAEIARRIGPDGELLDALLARSTLPAQNRKAVRQGVLGEFLG
jgi:hypothetical protein